MALQITDANFDELVKNAQLPAMVDLWAEWCGPCRQMGPLVDELAAEFEGKMVIGKLDVDGSPNVPMTYRVRNIPTFLFFKNGELVSKMVGTHTKEEFVSEIQKLL